MFLADRYTLRNQYSLAFIGQNFRYAVSVAYVVSVALKAYAPVICIYAPLLRE